MHDYVFCFDIANNKARYQVGNLLLDYGIRVQGSVFELALKNHREIQTIIEQIETWVDLKTDDVRYYYLSKESMRRSMSLCGEKVKQVPATIIF